MSCVEELKIANEQPPHGNISFLQRYSILKEIGEGGMGVVYLARDKILNREVAIKRLRVSSANEHAWLRFEMEAKACAALRHPNIVSIFDFGADEEGVPYIVLDYLAGQTLRALLEQKNVLTFAEMFNIVLPLLDGLEHAHNSGVVHRDLKPANIFLQKIDGSELKLVKIMDFGISKVISDRESGFKTKTGQVFGSPFYISPEQIAGDDVDARADLYALGCMIFEMLTGKPPFIGANLLATFKMQQDAPPPSLREKLDGQPFCAPVGEIVDRLLKKNRALRYKDVAELKEDLIAAEIQWSDDPQRLLKRGGQTTAATSVENIYSSKINEKAERSGTFVIEGKRLMIMGTLVLGVALSCCSIYVAWNESSRQVPKTTAARYSKLGYDPQPLALSDVKVDKKGTLSLTEVTNFDEISKSIAGRVDITCIDLEDMNAHEGSFKNLRRMPNLTEIKCIDVFDLTANMIKDITAIETIRRLEVTAMAQKNPLPEDIFEPLRGSRVNALLICADLSEKQVRDLCAHETLDALNLARCNMNLELLSSFKALKKLRYLRMEGMGITGEELAEFRQMPSLKEIYLNMNPLRASSLRKLRPLPQVERLAVFRSVSFADAELIETVRIFPNLKYIDLGCTKITDAAVKALAELNDLRQVNFTDDRITNKSLQFLARARKLEIVDISACDVSSQGIEKLMRDHRKLEITHSVPADLESANLQAVADKTGCKLKNADAKDVNMLLMDSVSEGLGK